MSLIALAAEESVNTTLSWGVGAGILLLFLFLIGALVAFGGGREHS